MSISPSTGVMVQKYELVDPLSPSVVQPSDVRSGRASARQLYRLHTGSGLGRVAAGEVVLLSHPQLVQRKGGRGGRGGGGKSVHSSCYKLLALAGVALAIAWRATHSAPLPPPPQPLLRFSEEGEIELLPHALSLLRSAEGPVCIVSIVRYSLLLCACSPTED